MSTTPEQTSQPDTDTHAQHGDTIVEDGQLLAFDAHTGDYLPTGFDPAWLPTPDEEPWVYGLPLDEDDD